MTNPKDISIQDFTYLLPDEKIALHPPAQRGASRLLLYQNGHISDEQFVYISRHLPANSLLIFNDTRVIKARIRFQKESGGIIEIFCLEPYEAISEYATVMSKKGSVRWKCMIGGASKWKGGNLSKELAMDNGQCSMNASLVEKLADAYVVEFSWEPAGLSFAEVIEQAGDIPLPPYIKRSTDQDDTERYQTIYAKDEGSVAAPTAGLHFTETIFEQLRQKNIHTGFVTLHVGAGTFRPVKAATMQGHDMHAEWIDVHINTIGLLCRNCSNTITAVGTTSLRTLESLYWMGLKVLLDPGLQNVTLAQWEVYEAPLANTNTSTTEALEALIHWMKKNKMERLFTQTRILIAPGYQFRVVNALVTNFHQPQSTLLLLVAAAVGDNWKKIYDHALQHDYRFLSYGDSSLLFIK